MVSNIFRKHLFSIFVFYLIFLFGFCKGSFAVIWNYELDDAGRHEIALELDPYYSNTSYTYALTADPIPKRTKEDERNVYLYLLRNFLFPRYILLEASINPLPIAGVYLKSDRTKFYEDNQLTNNFNAVKAITAGFPEPWALSFFFGNIVNFVQKDNDKLIGKGYSGLLLSYGNKHIVDNIMVDDHWFEVEIKVKGSNIRKKRDLSWSYALGFKGHKNEEIKDALYVSIKRSRVDYFIDKDINPLWKFFFRNSEQEARIDFDREEIYKGKIIRYLFLFGKKFIFGDGKFAFSMSMGVLKTVASGYTGELEEKIDDRWSLIIRPNIHIKFD